MESFLYDTFYEEVSGNKTKAKYKKTRRPGECKVCGKSFNDKNAVYVHMRIHTGEKPYVCEVCGKGFNQNSNLKRHLKYHRGERPYHCDVCNKDISCSSRPHFLEHVRAHEGIKPYACNLCSNTYSFKASLINHMKSHEKTHFFVCDICQAGFIYEGQLNNHMRSTHDADYVANKCIICKEVFPATYKLSDHLAKSHDIFTAYECKVCQKRYYNQQALRLHYEEHLEVPSSASKRRKKKTFDVPEEENSNTSNVSENQNEDISNVTEVKCENETEDKDITDIPVSTSYVKEVITPEQLEILLRRGIVSHEGRSDYYEVDVNNENVYIIENEDVSNNTESNARVIPSSHYTSGSQVEEVITPDYPELILGHGTVNPRFVCGICEKEFGSEAEINKHFEAHEKSKNVPIIQNEAISNVTEDKAKNIVVTSDNNKTNVKTVITQKDLELLHSHGPVNHRFLCGVCGEEFGNEAEINKHLETHTKSKNVPIIQNDDVSNVIENKAKDNVVPSDTNVKTVITQKDLQRLLSRGPVNHRFLCAVCGKDFSSKTEIDKHLKTHTKVEKLFICGICKDRFSSGDELKSHITNTHDI